MELKEFSEVIERKTSKRVRYVPGHAHGDKHHPDCEDGIVSSIGSAFVFVKFQKSITRHGFDGATAQACSVEDLVIL